MFWKIRLGRFYIMSFNIVVFVFIICKKGWERVLKIES